MKCNIKHVLERNSSKFKYKIGNNGMPDQESPNSDDNISFEELLRDVKPLRKKKPDNIELNYPKPEPTPRETHKDNQRVLKESLEISLEYEDLQPGDSLSYCKPGIQKAIFRKLKKGQFNIEAELDLHGLTVAQAQETLLVFIKNARIAHNRCVRIIHGKGYGSSNKGPRLKPMVNQWLQKRNEILAFCSARPTDGGTGAVYVLLKSLT